MLDKYQSDMSGDVLTVEEVGAILKISRTKAYEFVNSSQFPIKKIGRVIRIPSSTFYLWLNSNQ